MKAWLSLSGAQVDLRDFFGTPFNEKELRELLGERLPSDQFSWASPSFKKLGLARGSLSEDQLIELMIENPRLIRRPLIQVDGKLLPPVSGVNKIVQALEEALK